MMVDCVCVAFPLPRAARCDAFFDDEDGVVTTRLPIGLSTLPPHGDQVNAWILVDGD